MPQSAAAYTPGLGPQQVPAAECRAEQACPSASAQICIPQRRLLLSNAKGRRQLLHLARATKLTGSPELLQGRLQLKCTARPTGRGTPERVEIVWACRCSSTPERLLPLKYEEGRAELLRPAEPQPDVTLKASGHSAAHSTRLVPLQVPLQKLVH